MADPRELWTPTLDPTPRPAHVGRSEVPAALDVPRRDVPPYSFKGSPCNLTQLRVLIADACDMRDLPRLMMDDAAIYAEDHSAWPARRVKFTRAIDEGVSVVNPEWTEDE